MYKQTKEMLFEIRYQIRNILDHEVWRFNKSGTLDDACFCCAQRITEVIKSEIREALKCVSHLKGKPKKKVGRRRRAGKA